MFVDMNECEVYNGHCDHDCTNSNGSYACSCRDGFYPNNDSQSCDGEY